jgi:hypothetical protein
VAEIEAEINCFLITDSFDGGYEKGQTYSLHLHHFYCIYAVSMN